MTNEFPGKMDKPNRKKYKTSYKMGYGTLKHVKLFENFDSVDEAAKTKELTVADKNTVHKDFYKLLKDIMKTSAEIEKEIPKTEASLVPFDEQIKKMEAALKKKKAERDEVSKPIQEKIEGLKAMKQEALDVLVPLKAKNLEIKDLMVQINTIVVEKGVYNKDGSPKTTYSWSAIAEANEKLVPVNKTNIKLLEDIKEANKHQKLDVMGPDLDIKLKESLNEGIIDWFKGIFDKVSEWFGSVFGGLAKNVPEMDAAVVDAKSALGIVESIK